MMKTVLGIPYQTCRTSALAGVSLMMLMAASSASAQLTPNQAAAKCAQVYAKYADTSVRNIAGNTKDQIAIKNCIDLGIDPPLVARSDWGIRPAQGVALSNIPSAACPPFETCLSEVKRAQGTIDISAEGKPYKGGEVYTFPPTGLSAPEFEGVFPVPKPEHLQGGGTIYFYDPVTIEPPADSLIYADQIQNEYADGGNTGVEDTYVASPPPSDPTDIMSTQPTIIKTDALFNFVDGGIAILPAGFVGVINGQPVKGGDVIVINHAGDIRMPAGTQLIPFPDGYLGAMGTHYNWPNYTPYAGPPLQMPPNPAMTINPTKGNCDTRCDEPYPGTEWF
ncbi:MAG: hypothetical protein FJX23_01945 [Alphaproteobacteria bacterium]|nr:hypothetical protein [Alphaproteobacteria bacterium]